MKPVKNMIAVGLVTLLTSNSFAQTAEPATGQSDSKANAAENVCYNYYAWRAAANSKGLTNKVLSDIGAGATVVGYIGGGLLFGGAGVLIGGVAPAMAIIGIDAAVRAIKVSGYDRMMKLIDQAEASLDSPGEKPGRLLKKLYKKLSRENENLTLEEVANFIVTQSRNGNLCKIANNFSELKSELSKNGDLMFEELESEDTATK